MSVCFVALFAGEHFRRHISERAGNILGRKILEPRHAHHAEIDQFERALGLENDIVRLDVAMNDAGAVQRRHPARELDRDIAALFQTRPAAAAPAASTTARPDRAASRCRGRSAAPGGNSMTRPTQGLLTRAPTQASRDEGGMIGGDRGDLGLGKFQRHFAALDLVESAEQAGIAAVRHQHFEHEAVDRLAVDRRRDQRQLHDVGADIGRFRRRQIDHVDDERRAIVGAARDCSAAATSARAVSSEAERWRRMSAM